MPTSEEKHVSSECIFPQKVSRILSSGQAKHILCTRGDVRPCLGTSRLSDYTQRGVISANFLAAPKQAPSRKRPAETLDELNGSSCYQRPSAASSGVPFGGGWGACSGSGGAGDLTPENEVNHVNPRVVFPAKVSRLTKQGR